jgi:hypothetical protein
MTFTIEASNSNIHRTRETLDAPEANESITSSYSALFSYISQKNFKLQSFLLSSVQELLKVEFSLVRLHVIGLIVTIRPGINPRLTLRKEGAWKTTRSNANDRHLYLVSSEEQTRKFNEVIATKTPFGHRSIPSAVEGWPMIDDVGCLTSKEDDGRSCWRSKDLPPRAGSRWCKAAEIRTA